MVHVGRGAAVKKKSSKTRATDHAPKHLSSTARAIYSEVFPRLGVSPGFLALERLGAYAHEKAVWIEATAYTAEHGAVLVQRTEKGDVKAIIEDPHVRVAERARASFLGLAREMRLDAKG